MTPLSRARRRVRRHIAKWRNERSALGESVREAERSAGIGLYRNFLLAAFHSRIFRRLTFAEKWSGLTGSPAVLDAARRDALATLIHLGIADPLAKPG